MKAAVRSEYGSADVIGIRDIPKPVAKDDEVLVKVHAASVSRTDCHVLTGKPFIMKIILGLFKPRSKITGSDFAGEIETVGKHVTSFKPGDRVMGFGGVFASGSHAEFLAFREKKGIVQIPDILSYVEAAACLEGAYYALSGLDKINLHAGQKALVVGGTGAIGSATIQFLKLHGLYITAVCRGEHSDLVRSLGADKIIDYATKDFTKDDERYDFVFDTIGPTSFGKVKNILNDKGAFFPAKGMWNLVLSFTTRLTGGKKVVFTAPQNIKRNLTLITDLVRKGKFKPVIDKIYPLDKISEAFHYVASGQKVGNVIIRMDI